MYRPLNGRRRGSTLAGLELARQPLDPAHQDGEVGADGGEQRAELHAAPRKGEVVGQHARRLARGGHAGDGSLHRRDDFGVEEFARVARSEEHTSELQSLMRISYAVFCLKKKNTKPTDLHATP